MLSESCGDNLHSFGPSPTDACPSNNLLFFMMMINGLLRRTCEVADGNGRIVPKTVPDDEYDFIVIGSGTAGATVAGRLAEVKHWKILLIEAGDDEPVGAQVPSFSFSYLGSSIDWNFMTEPEPVGCQGFHEKRCTWPRGKVLGGTSVINGMMFIRGTKMDYQKWADAGNPDWTYKKLLPHFISYENNRNLNLVDKSLHGTEGPLTIERYPNQPSFAWDVLKAGQEIGYNVSDDLSGEVFSGFAVAQMNSKNGVRLSLAKAFVRPHRNNPNFHVMLNSTATKILLDGNKRAKAVQLIYNNKTFEVHVKKEVIVSAGAVQTPQILLLSGIGEKSLLESVGIQQIHNLPAVGKGLKNHVSFQLVATLNQNHTNILNMTTLAEYIDHQTGAMSSTGLAQVTARIHSEYSTVNDPDIQFYFGGFVAKCANDDRVAKEKIEIYPTYLHSKSRGYISLHSNDPFAPPKIVANYLTNDKDVNGLVAGIRVAQKLINSNLLKTKYGIELEKNSYGKCDSTHQWDSDDFWKCAVKYQTGHENHQGSSCRMGPKNDPDACVDQQLKLHGIENVRVIDASIFPDLPSANPQATIVMVAERGAGFIKNDYLNRVRRK